MRHHLVVSFDVSAFMLTLRRTADQRSDHMDYFRYGMEKRYWVFSATIAITLGCSVISFLHMR